ncbi:hypothetical protein [Thermomonospora catenispora]|uniref:hypothetical protein n=1 Tax=Thermomonospora catenispora TaxID=2493090 RepID=UPI00112326B0|nr:hypothetical protein [Thermomonospora catenispora]TNY35986.1 hypothetical protein EIO00_16045 [Thermomonospora catenispora]
MADPLRHPESAPRPGRPAPGTNADVGRAPEPHAAVSTRWAAVRRALRWRARTRTGAGTRALRRLPRHWSNRLAGRLRSQLARGRSLGPVRPWANGRVNGHGTGGAGKNEAGSVIVKTPAVERAGEGKVEPGAERCSFVRDFAPDGEVLREEEIQRLSRHAAHCLQCMEHFIALVGDTATGSSAS